MDTHHLTGPSEEGMRRLDIGGDVGAAIVSTPASLVGSEIEIRRCDTTWDGTHVAVRERQVAGGVMHAALFPGLGVRDLRGAAPRRRCRPSGGLHRGGWPRECDALSRRHEPPLLGTPTCGDRDRHLQGTANGLHSQVRVAGLRRDLPAPHRGAPSGRGNAARPRCRSRSKCPGQRRWVCRSC